MKYPVSTETAKAAAIKVLLNNMHGPYSGLPRTAGWGYPEPYTRDLMIASLGILASGNEELINSFRKVLKTLAKNQTGRGHIPSLVHNASDLGSSDTTPLFLMGLGLYRMVTGEQHFLDDAAQKALTWMDYQSPDEGVMVTQMPTTDWRDEQWIWGYGLYVNTIVYIYLVLFGEKEKANRLKSQFNNKVVSDDSYKFNKEGLSQPKLPYYALWTFKIYNNTRFDLLGNSLAILSGIASPVKSGLIVKWVEKECKVLRKNKELNLNVPPNFFPYIRPEDADWKPRYESFNFPGDYHNGGIWPFINGFYTAAVLKAGFPELANSNLEQLNHLVKLSRNPSLDFGFNEWIKAQTGIPQGQDWQTWSAAMYLYAAISVEKGHALFFDEKFNL